MLTLYFIHVLLYSPKFFDVFMMAFLRSTALIDTILSFTLQNGASIFFTLFSDSNIISGFYGGQIYIHSVIIAWEV